MRCRTTLVAVSVFALCASVVVLAGCTRGYVRKNYVLAGTPSSPPPMLHPDEPPSPPPGPEEDYKWLPGHWEWEGEWVWYYGDWVRKPHPDAEWVDSHWARDTDREWFWKPGYWKLRAASATLRSTFPQ